MPRKAKKKPEDPRGEHPLIYVFYSNYLGKHLYGTSKIALDKYGAIFGQARGHQGNAWGICVTACPPAIITTDDLDKQLRELCEFANTYAGRILVPILSSEDSDNKILSMRDICQSFLKTRTICQDVEVWDHTEVEKYAKLCEENPDRDEIKIPAPVPAQLGGLLKNDPRQPMVTVTPYITYKLR